MYSVARLTNYVYCSWRAADSGTAPATHGEPAPRNQLHDRRGAGALTAATASQAVPARSTAARHGPSLAAGRGAAAADRAMPACRYRPSAVRPAQTARAAKPSPLPSAPAALPADVARVRPPCACGAACPLWRDAKPSVSAFAFAHAGEECAVRCPARQPRRPGPAPPATHSVR